MYRWTKDSESLTNDLNIMHSAKFEAFLSSAHLQAPPTHSLPALVECCEHVSGLCLAVELLILKGHVPNRFLVFDSTLEQLIRNITTGERERGEREGERGRERGGERGRGGERNSSKTTVNIPHFWKCTKY